MRDRSMGVIGKCSKFPMAVLFVALAVAPSTVNSLGLTATEIQDCLANEYGLECIDRDVVTFPIADGGALTLELVSVITIQKDGEPTALEETFWFEVTKERPQVTYPLKYVHTVPYFPYEQEECAGDNVCDASPNSSSPTCGWTYQGSDTIEDSQGFCSSDAKAHCMRLGELYFHGYELGMPSTYFEVDIKAQKGEERYEIKLTPAETRGPIDEFTQQNPFTAELIADLDGYREAPDLSNYILYIPSAPDTHPYVKDYQNNMLLVPREEVSIDGTECDKVGTGFHAFRAQEAHLNTREIGDCLHNQLFHKHNADLQKLITNPAAETSYLVHGRKIFKGSMEFEHGMEKALVFKPVASSEKSMVAITMSDLESVKLVTTESPGIIVQAWVEPFISMSREGTMVVDILNQGDLKTEYIVSVIQCNMNIVEAIPQQTVTLEPDETTTRYFDIHTVFNLETTNACLVQLRSPANRLYDELIVEFDTFKHQADYPWDRMEKNDGGEIAVCADPCVDDDFDGICESTGADNCLNTPEGDVVDTSGCSIEQLCPCNDPGWKNHGKYVSCVSQAADSLFADGLITEDEKDAIVAQAGGSDCGK